MQSALSLGALALLLVAALLPRAASAQLLFEEQVETQFTRARAELRTPRGAVALLRMEDRSVWVDPSLVVDRLQRVLATPGIAPSRAALVRLLLARRLRALGETREAETQRNSLGFLTRWLVVGPFANEGRAGFDEVQELERDRGARPDLTHAYDGKERPVRWRAWPELSSDGAVRLDVALRPVQNTCAFAHTTVTAARDADAVLWLGAAGQLRAWVDGNELYRDEAERGLFADRVGVPVHLTRGPHRVLLKLCTGHESLSFFARFTDRAGATLAGLTHDSDPALAPVQPVPTRPALVPEAQLQGDFWALRRAAQAPNAPPDALEEYARYLELTGSDNRADPTALDLVRRVAERAPSVDHWLLLNTFETERNRRLAAAEHALAMTPDDPRALTALGHDRALGASPQEALPLFERAAAANEAYLSPRLERVNLLDRLGLNLRALAEVRALVARSPRAPALLRGLAVVAGDALQSDEAQAAWARYLLVAATDASALETLAREARAQGDRPRVRTLVDRLVAVHPDALRTYTVGAELLEASGQAEAAVGLLTRATELCPDEAALWIALGELEVRRTHRDEGRTALRRALSLAPQNATLRQQVEWLEPPLPRPDEALAEASAVFLQRRARDSEGGYRLRILQDLTVRTVYPSGLSGSFNQTVFQVMSPEGAEALRNFPVQYQPDSQRFELRAARIFHPDGAVDESSTLQEYSLTGGAQRMYYDNRAAVIGFARLRPGDVVELRWRVDDSSARNEFANYFGDLHMLQSESPRAQVRYVLSAPTGRQLYFHVPTTLPGLERSDRVDGDRHTYEFVAHDVPALVPEEHAPGPTERAAYLHVSTYRTWEDVGRWYWGLVSDQLRADDRVRALVREATRGATTPVQRVRAVYDWVIRNTRYVALEFGIHGFLPYRVPEVCARGFGDCKDKASTIVTMLREVGIDASIVLVRTRRNGQVDPSPASLAVFDHAIAYVPPMEGYPDGLYLDGTANTSGMDELPSGDQGAMALVVNQRGEARQVTIPVYGPDHSTMSVQSEVTVSAQGSATVHVNLEAHGSYAAYLRGTFEAVATRAERIEAALRGFWPGVHVTRVRFDDLAEVERPARGDYDAQVPILGTRQGTELLVSPFNALNLTREYAGQATRINDVMVPGPATSDERRTLRLPAGATFAAVPDAVHLDTPLVQFDLEYERQGASALVVHQRYVLKTHRVAVAQYAAWREACQRVDEAQNRRITIHLGGTP